MNGRITASKGLYFKNRIPWCCSHSDLAGEYARKKEQLARFYSGDRDAYQREKDKVIEKILDAWPARWRQ